MAIKDFVRLQTGSGILNRIQDSITRSGNEESDFQKGALVKDITLAGGTPQEVQHGLGRKALGAVMVKSSVPTDYAFRDSQVDTSRFILIESGAGVTASFWVF